MASNAIPSMASNVIPSMASNVIPSMASNATLPPLPSYTLRPASPLVPGIPDKILSPILLIIVYWIVSLSWHVVDTYDLWPQYRLHTPEEVLKRNPVSRWDVLKDVLIQQLFQAIFGIGLGIAEEDAMIGKEPYDIAVWAQRIRIAQRLLPRFLALVGVDSLKISGNLASSHPILAGVFAGGQYDVHQPTSAAFAPGFATWELSLAKIVYYLAVPVVQFTLAIVIVDTWQYFLHRAMHLNKWLYTTFHSRHHRLYVPYAYGALYNHPVEGFLLDTLGAGMAYLVTGMTCRQGMLFFSGCTIKTIDDHCGYALPWDPLQHLTSNNAGYHDVHHQSWGIKTNFSQPFFTFWDRFLGTKYEGDATLRYERDRKAMERRTAAQQKQVQVNDTEPIRPVPSIVESIEKSLPDSAPSLKALEDSVAVPEERALRRSPRKKTPSVSQTSAAFAGPIKELRSRMNTSLHGKASGVLGVESSH